MTRQMASMQIYMDNHATTRVDRRVVEAMLPFFESMYGNPASTSHSFGWEGKEAVDQAREKIAAAIGASAREIVFTSGATESNNLAIRGLAERQRRRGNRLVTVTTEHKAVLDPIERLGRRGFEITIVDVEQAGSSRAGWLDPQKVRDALRDDTLLVSVMLANNEIGVIQPLAEIAAICRERGVPLHCDATQAVGKLPVDVRQLGIDLMSFSAHKLYGPKGVGALWIRRGSPPIKLEPLIAGGGHEGGVRSGTLNVPGIVGFARALELCIEELPAEADRLAAMRNRLFAGLEEEIEGVTLNGPVLEVGVRGHGLGAREDEESIANLRSSAAIGPSPRNSSARSANTSLHPRSPLAGEGSGERGPASQFAHASPLRLPGNLNVSFDYVDGEALLINMKDIAVSSGSACTSANPEPSHVLRALGLGEESTRSSLRYGLGRFNTPQEVERAIEITAEVVKRLRKLSSLA